MDITHVSAYFFIIILPVTTSAASKACGHAEEIGSFGIQPWGSSTFFADQTAKWLLVDLGFTNLHFKYVNHRPVDVSGKLHIVGNLSFEIKVNGVSSGWFSGMWNSNPYTKIPFTFSQAANPPHKILISCFDFVGLSLQ